MTVRRRKCRALNCPRRVNDRVLFCNVHWTQLPPKYQRPIESNQEPPKYATLDDARAVTNGTGAAVAYLAGKEGQKTQLAQAQAAAASAPATGTVASEVDRSGRSGVASAGSAGTGRSSTTRSDL